MKRFERLKSLREKSAIMVVEALENDYCDMVRHEAAFILGDTFSHLSKMEFKLVKAALGDKSVLVRHEACLALAKFKTQNALDALLVASKDPSPEVRSSADYAIEEMMFSTK